LPVMFLEKAKSAGFMPIIVNAGPENSESDLKWPVEVAKMVGADAVLIGQVRALATTGGRKANNANLRGHVLLSSHAVRLVLSAKLLDAGTGRELTAVEAEETVKGAWFSEAAARFSVIGSMLRGESFWFADTHFGQAITRAAEKLISGIAKPVSQASAQGAY